MGLHPEYHQRGTLSHSHITQVLHHLLIFSDGFALNHLRCSQNISLFTRESRSTKLSVMKERKNLSRKCCYYYNWLELHFSWKVLFPGWQLILASRSTQASIKLSWSMRAYWLTGAFFFFSSMKRQTVNISAGVFSLSNTSWSKVSFPNFVSCSVLLSEEIKNDGQLLGFFVKLNVRSQQGTFKNSQPYSFHRFPNFLDLWIICARGSPCE